MFQQATTAVSLHTTSAAISGEFSTTPRSAPSGALVVSHERSGTHFLINTLACCYGRSLAWLDFDYHGFRINFHSPADVAKVLRQVAQHEPDRTVKSHHSVEFFQGVLAEAVEHHTIFYICRHPVDVMLSCWRLMHGWPWVEGPKVDDPLTFARAEPCGQMLRYQMRQYPNMLVRWAAHVEGWLEAAQREPRIVVVRYEDLDQRYEASALRFASALGRRPTQIVRPARTFNVIGGGPEDPTGRGILVDRCGLSALCRQTVGSTMSRVGY